MFDAIKALFNHGRYKAPDNAVVISCFYNPENSPYRLLAFQKFYRTIKHLNHRIIECTIGDAKPQLPDSPFLSRVKTESLLWHKEALLNKLIRELPDEYDYVFWVDADIIFTNDHWMNDAVECLKEDQIIQPFEYCIHLDRNEIKPSFDVEANRLLVHGSLRHPNMWRSFGANFSTTPFASSTIYDQHGHVGFAWGARRSLLEKVPLYDKALIGGADHIMAHAAAGHIPHKCIEKSFTADLDNVMEWSKRFYAKVDGDLGYCEGDVYHLWHGDIDKRAYLKRIQDFTPQSKTITKRDANGLYVATGNNAYMHNYYRQREANINMDDEDFDDYDDGSFATDMGYAIGAIGQMFGQPASAAIPVQVDNTTYPLAPDPNTTPVEASYSSPDPNTTPVEASYDSPTLSHMDSPSADTTPVEASYDTPSDSGNFS